MFSQYYAFRERKKITSLVFLPKVSNLNLISIQEEKTSDSNWDTSTKLVTSTHQKCEDNERQGKSEIIRDWKRQNN